MLQPTRFLTSSKGLESVCYKCCRRASSSAFPFSSITTHLSTTVTPTTPRRNRIHHQCLPAWSIDPSRRRIGSGGAGLRNTLGAPIPLNAHAVSVTLPLWSHVIGYEENDPTVTTKLVLGYPRFVYHPYVKQLVEVWKTQALANELIQAHEVVEALPFPSLATAQRCHRFLQDAHSHEPGFPVSIHPIPKGERGGAADAILDTYMVVFPAKAAAEAKAYWQHSGEILSSRKAQAILLQLGHPVPCLTEGFPSPGPPLINTCAKEGETSKITSTYCQALKQRLAQMTGQETDHVHLTISGMAAIFKAFHICKSVFPDRKVVVFGFTYLDTLKICLRKEWSHGVHFLGRGDKEDMKTLERILEKEKIMGLFTEFPSNPLLNNPNLPHLSILSKEHGFPIVVDDTISNFHNVNLLQDVSKGGVDIVVSSLTKLFSGKGDVMAGSLVINKHSSLRQKLLLAAINTTTKETNDAELYEEDAQVAYLNGQDFEDRSSRINQTTDQLVDWLQGQVGVKQIFYPRLSSQRAIYDAYKRPGGGYGGLFSISLEEGWSPSAFYDTLDVYKGPSLGTNFTLACPYTLLAHYNELEWAKAYGVCPNLVRVSVGLEPLESLKKAFKDALHAASTASFASSSTHLPPSLTGNW